MKKNGFTLAELLAVIAILAILVLIAIPNVMQLYNESKKETFTTELKLIVKAARNQWMNDSMFDTNEIVYSRCKGNTCTNQLKLSGRNEIEYFVKVNKNGEIVQLEVTDGTYQYEYNGPGLRIEEIDGVVQIANLNLDDAINISQTYSYDLLLSDKTTPRLVKGNINNLKIGDEICFGVECFNIIVINDNTVEMLAKYNLYVGNIFYASIFPFTFKETISESDPNYLKQSSIAKGAIYDGSEETIGTVQFSTKSYWSSGGNLLSKYGEGYQTNSSNENKNNIYDESISEKPIFNNIGETTNNNYSISYYVKEYKNSLGVNAISARLLSHVEFSNLKHKKDNDGIEFISGRLYWLSNAYTYQYVFNSSGTANDSYLYKNTTGVRPVIMVYKDSIR